jgi:hypothetical protein
VKSKTRRASPILRACYLIAVLFIGCSLVSCGSSSKNLQLAQDSVGLFHAQLDMEQYGSIYGAADDKFRNASTEADFVKLLRAIHTKLGAVRESNLRTSGVAWFAGQGATVTLVYDTKFMNGTGSEQFVWLIKDNQTTLYNYRIDSNDLIVK